MTRGLPCTLLTRVSQVASPRKSAKMRLERVQKINRVSRSLFGPVIKSEFRSYAQMEMTKYQLQAANKWSFDFANESPIAEASGLYEWDAAKLPDVPSFYHHIVNPSSIVPAHSNGDSLLDECENICPLSHNVSASIKSRQRVVVTAASSGVGRSVCLSQTKITDYLKVRKRRLSTASAVSLKKARAEL